MPQVKHNKNPYRKKIKLDRYSPMRITPSPQPRRVQSPGSPSSFVKIQSGIKVFSAQPQEKNIVIPKAFKANSFSPLFFYPSPNKQRNNDRNFNMNLKSFNNLSRI